MLFFFKQKTAYEMRISDWSSDVCSSDLYIAVEPRWAERVLSHQPARGKDDKIAIGDSRNSAGAGQDREDTGIGMVETDRPNGVESAEEIGRASCRERGCQYV